MAFLNSLSYIWSHPMNRGNRLGSMSRYLKWQLGSRILNRPILHDWIDDTQLVIRSGETGLTQNIYNGLQDFEDMAFILHAMREDDCFLDIGANAGSYTLLACSVCGARGYAFEPVPSTFERLTQNCAVNHLNDRVTCLCMAVGNEPGTLKFTADLDCMNHIIADGEDHEGDIISIPVVRLNDMELDQCPTFIKMDVEGFETPAIEGASNLFSDSSLLGIVIELNGSGERYGYDETSLQQSIESFGFLPYEYQPFERRFKPLGSGNKHYGNTLFLRDIETLEQRVQASKTYQINGCNL